MVSAHNLTLPRVGDLANMLDLDHAATAPLSAAAREAMEPFLDNRRHGNPSGSHLIARDAVRAVDEAREVVAECIGCRPDEVVFTSGGTEADNHAVTGGMPPREGVPICSAVEHHAVLEPTLRLGGSTIEVDSLGRVIPSAISQTIERVTTAGSTVGVVSVMAANNEIGTMNDIPTIAAELEEVAPGVPLHTDAVQAAPWLDLSHHVSAAHLVSVSAHKLGGPKGTGALVVRRGVKIAPLILGGAQERELRGGTTNVAGVVGFAAAFRETVADRAGRSAKVAALRDRLAELILTGVDRVSQTDGVVEPGVTETAGPLVAAALGLPADRSHLLPGHLHLTVEGVSSEELLLLLEAGGVCASAASSCASGAVGASHVLEAIGMDLPGAAALRLSLGPDLDLDDIEAVAMAFHSALGRLRERAR